MKIISINKKFTSSPYSITFNIQQPFSFGIYKNITLSDKIHVHFSYLKNQKVLRTVIYPTIKRTSIKLDIDKIQEKLDFIILEITKDEQNKQQALDKVHVELSKELNLDLE